MPTWSVVPLVSGTSTDTAASFSLSQDGALIRRSIPVSYTHLTLPTNREV